MGSAWFVDEVQKVTDSNQELLGLSSLDYKKTCLSTHLDNKTYSDSSKNYVEVVEKMPNKIIYKVFSNDTGFIVFSEAFYKNGWVAKINGEVTDIHKVNYLLRGLEVEGGEHEIVFTFEPAAIKTGTFLMASSNILLLILVFFYFRNLIKNVH